MNNDDDDDNDVRSFTIDFDYLFSKDVHRSALLAMKH